MKRASYRQAVDWIATNDEPGGDEALDASVVAEMVTVALVADLFEVDQDKVAKDVVRHRNSGKRRLSDAERQHLEGTAW